MSLTKRIVISTLKRKDLKFFTIPDICKLFGISNNYASQMIYQLKMDDKVVEIEKGKYTFPESSSSPFLIASKTIQPSYISFKTALYVYDMRGDWEGDVYVATPKRKRPLEFKKYNFKYITLKPYKFFGFCHLNIKGNDVIIAEPEKAIVDSLEEMDYGPEIMQFKNILEDAVDFLSIGKLLNYTRRCHNKSLMARLCYLLEMVGVEVSVPEKYLPKDYIKFDPSGERKGRWISRWNIIDNL